MLIFVRDKTEGKLVANSATYIFINLQGRKIFVEFVMKNVEFAAFGLNLPTGKKKIVVLLFLKFCQHFQYNSHTELTFT
jgi:hypothetical protein